MKDEELLKIATQLSPIVNSGKCIAWIGSGLPHCVGYKNWTETIEELCQNCDVELIPGGINSPEKLMKKAEECKINDEDNYHKTLVALFCEQPITATRAAYDHIMKLPFKTIVTTNYDSLLAHAGSDGKSSGISYYPYLSISRLEQSNLRPIFHLHGLAWRESNPTGKKLVLASSEFYRAYEDPGIVKNFLKQLFIEYPAIFLGCRLSEPELMVTFKSIRKIHRDISNEFPEKKGPLGYLLLATDSFPKERSNIRRREEELKKEEEEEEEFNNMGIEVIRYYPEDKSHREIERILIHLIALANIPSTSVPIIRPVEDMPS